MIVRLRRPRALCQCRVRPIIECLEDRILPRTLSDGASLSAPLNRSQRGRPTAQGRGISLHVLRRGG
jgi:hypothetical protein